VEAVDTSTWADRLEQNMQVALDLDALPRQSALLALNDLMKQMDRVVGKYKLDVLLAKTSQVHTPRFVVKLSSPILCETYTIYQGRGVGRQSRIDLIRSGKAKVTQTQETSTPILKYPDQSSQNSSVGKLKSAGVLKPAPGSRKPKPPGVCLSKSQSKVWHCEPCNAHITNNSVCITQHLGGSKHVANVEDWGVKPYAQFICEMCQECMANEPIVLRNHFRAKHSTVTTLNIASSPAVSTACVKFWHCESCNLNIPSDAESVHAHNASLAHQRQNAYDRNISRADGIILAAATRKENESMQANGTWITVHKKDGTTKNKFVKATNKSSNTGDKNDNNLMVCVLCYGHVIISM
jgi:hypothetical protein